MISFIIHLGKIYIYLYVFLRMAKKPLNLLVDENLVQKARKHGLIISRFLENQLEDYFNFIESTHKRRFKSADAGNRTRAEGLEGPNHSL